MANPTFEIITEGEWVKIATNVTSGTVHMKSTAPLTYLQMYKVTGDAAPTLETDGVPIFEESNQIPIASSIGIDVYLWCVGKDGYVRIDI